MSEVKSFVADYLRHVWNEGAIEECDRFLRPTYTIHHDPGDPWDGKTLTLEEMKNRIRVSRAPFPDQVFDIEMMLEDPNRVAVAWKWKGTFTGDMPPFKATHKPVTMSGITIYYMEGERITGHWQVVDRLTLLRQLK
jgi:predicted ester cyclase